MKFDKFTLWFVLLFAASTCFAQMYTVNDLGVLPTGNYSYATAINNLGQVTGWANILTSSGYRGRAFLWTQGNGMQDLGVLPCLNFCWPNYSYFSSVATGVNDSSVVAGWSWVDPENDHAFTWKSGIGLQDLGTPGGMPGSHAQVINNSGHVAGVAYENQPSGMGPTHAFLWTPQSGMQLLGNLPGGQYSYAYDINDLGQIVGTAHVGGMSCCEYHAFLWTNSGGMRDLGTLNGGTSIANAINAFGQVVGWSYTFGSPAHAFRTAANSPINAATDDLGPGTANDIDDYGQVVGGALYSNGQWHDLNSLIPPDSACVSVEAIAINGAGQLAANATCSGQAHAVLLTPVYKTFVQQPINADGSSVFSTKRGVVPVKFAVTQYGTQPSCTLPATIGIVRAGNGTLASVDESTYSNPADSGSNFRIDSSACQYVYNLAASALGVGTYRVDISINGIMVGHAVFALN